MIDGGCLCGKITYAAEGDISDFSHCHCSMCRKLHGAAYVTFAAVPRKGFAWKTGEDQLRTYASSVAIDRYFCNQCGSQLGCYYQPEPELLYLAMGTANGNPDHPPDYHIFAASKAPWHEITDGKPAYDEWPDK